MFFNTAWKTLGADCLVRGQVSHYLHWLSSGQGVPKSFVPLEPPTSPRTSGRTVGDQNSLLMLLHKGHQGQSLQRGHSGSASLLCMHLQELKKCYHGWFALSSNCQDMMSLIS